LVHSRLAGRLRLAIHRFRLALNEKLYFIRFPFEARHGDQRLDNDQIIDPSIGRRKDLDQFPDRVESAPLLNRHKNNGNTLQLCDFRCRAGQRSACRDPIA
jgi:hypothetical protein